MNQENEAATPEFDKSDLYREDSFTDRKVGSIRQMTPVTETGDRDDARPMIFMGATQVMTGAGPVPLNFEIPGETLGAAVDNFGGCAEQAVEEMAAKLEEMRREQASSIVIPGQGNSGGSGLLSV
ncbi:MAG: hypothetical protein E2O50_01980 [Gammaproteobacteria bacterium]|nr:MAG: hypothetical protein E2O50_01980 [Gammaproteobacteria bacterium]